MKRPIVVNLLGVPGAGKSTGAAYIFSQLKMKGVNAELITEFAKDKVWEENEVVFKHQEYIFGKQSYKMGRCRDKVDIIVTDSPLILSILYNKSEYLGESFNQTVLDVYNTYTNLTTLVNRVKPYNPIGRHQTEEESDALKAPIKEMLEKYNIEYDECDGTMQDYDIIVIQAIELLHDLNMSENCE